MTAQIAPSGADGEAAAVFLKKAKRRLYAGGYDPGIGHQRAVIVAGEQHALKQAAFLLYAFSHLRTTPSITVRSSMACLSSGPKRSATLMERQLSVMGTPTRLMWYFTAAG